MENGFSVFHHAFKSFHISMELMFATGWPINNTDFPSLGVCSPCLYVNQAEESQELTGNETGRKIHTARKISTF